MENRISSFDRNRYYTKEFAIMARTAVAIGLMDNEERKFEPQFKPAVQTGLPAAYLKEDAPKIKAAFTQPGIYEVRLGSAFFLLIIPYGSNVPNPISATIMFFDIRSFASSTRSPSSLNIIEFNVPAGCDITFTSPFFKVFSNLFHLPLPSLTS